MKNIFAVLILLAAFTLGIMLTTSCSKKSDDSGTSANLSIPNMTGAVSSSSSTIVSATGRYIASENLRQQSGMLFSGTGPSGMAGSVFSMVQSFVSNAKTADSFACIIEVLANNGLLKTDGTAAVFSDDQGGATKAKFVVNATGGTLQNFKMYLCTASTISNDFYVEGSKSDSTMSFLMKYNIAGTLQGSMSMTGTLSGENWLTKTLTMETYLGASGSNVSKFEIAQNTDNMLYKGTLNTGVAGSTFQMFSKFGLLGNSPATYAMDEGSVKYAVGSAPSTDVLYHWDGAGTSQGTSAHSAAVTSGTYFPSNISFSGAITTEQSWDCTVSSESEIKTSGVSAGVSTGMQSCSENQQ